MGKASSTKKVARAARAGRTRGRRRSGSSLMFPGVLTLIVIVGVLLVVISRGERDASASPPALGDHWHAAIGFYVCGEFTPNLPTFENAQGLHTHGDGLIHIHPFSSEVTGSKATLGKYLSLVEPGVELTPDRLEIGGETYENGDNCGDEKAEVQVEVNGEKIETDPRDVRLADGQFITVAFVPDGDDIPDPPSRNVEPTDVLEAPTTTVPGQTTTTTEGQTTTTGAGGAATSAPDGATTTAPAAAPSTTASP